jgi:hypothetical protein
MTVASAADEDFGACGTLYQQRTALTLPGRTDEVIE